MSRAGSYFVPPERYLSRHTPCRRQGAAKNRSHSSNRLTGFLPGLAVRIAVSVGSMGSNHRTGRRDNPHRYLYRVPDTRMMRPLIR